MQSAWKKISQSTVFKGFREIVRKRFLLPNGQESDFDIIEVPSFAAIAALTPQFEVLLVEQFRPGPENFLLSFPEGRIDEEEEPENTAHRELREETGFQAREMHLLKVIPQAYSNQLKYCFVALGCEQVAEPSLDDTEFIQMSRWSLDEFKKLLADPRQTNFTSVDVGYLMLHFLESQALINTNL
ncbi:MAG: hypothetical protein OHK0053_15520 [Microscillaceae bacterium]